MLRRLAVGSTFVDAVERFLTMRAMRAGAMAIAPLTQTVPAATEPMGVHPFESHSEKVVVDVQLSQVPLLLDDEPPDEEEPPDEDEPPDEGVVAAGAAALVVFSAAAVVDVLRTT